MQNLKTLIVRLLLTGCVAITLSACGSNRSNVDLKGESSTPEFPALKDASRPDGSYVNLENLRKVTPGLTKSQLYELIGVPHFSEAMFNVREWDYIFKFSRPGNAEPRICQYKVMFDDNKIARSYLFLPRSCAQVLNAKGEAAAVSAVKKQKTLTKMTLQSDAAFDFSRYTLKPEVRHNLQRLTAQLEGKSIEQISVIGYADRIGIQQSNLALSRRRAEAVQNFLIKQGVRPHYIEVQGLGSTFPIMSCEKKMSKADLILCLSPNRRVHIKVTAS